MTINGWIQIALFCAVVIALTKPLGGYMTRVFAGERTLLRPVLGPLERGIYRLRRRAPIPRAGPCQCGWRQLTHGSVLTITNPCLGLPRVFSIDCFGGDEERRRRPTRRNSPVRA